MIIISIDPSTRTGFTVLKVKKRSIDVLHTEEFHVPASKEPYANIVRCGKCATRLEQLISEFKPDTFIIEGYSFASRHNLVTMAEIGTTYRYMLRQWGYDYLEVAPTQLKKFITGKGNGKKDLIILNVYKNWNFTIENDNIADSFGLAMFGAYQHLGICDEKGVWKKTDAKSITINDCR